MTPETVDAEKIAELISEKSTLQLGMHMLIMTMGDPKRDYKLLSSDNIPLDAKIGLFAAVYGTANLRLHSEWTFIRSRIRDLAPITKSEFVEKFTYSEIKDSSFNGRIISDRETFYNILCELQLDTWEDMLESKIPKGLLHILKD